MIETFTQLECAQACEALYGYAGESPMKFDHVDVGADDGVYWALLRKPGASLVVFRGSTTLPDWFADLQTWAEPIDHYAVGPVHYGFAKGLTMVLQEVAALTGNDALTITGHSLGAGRACIFTGMQVIAGRPPVARVCFGEPRPGFSRLGEIIKDVPAWSYRNKGSCWHDGVTDVPIDIPLVFPYVHPAPLIDVMSLPTNAMWMSWGMWAPHNIHLYTQALSGAQSAVVQNNLVA